MDVEFNASIASKLAPTGFALPWHNPTPFISGTCKGGDSLTVSSKTLHLFGIKAWDAV
jgi:hypothetical protein